MMDEFGECLQILSLVGALGAQVFSNAAGKPLDGPEFLPLFDEIANRNLAVWFHPARGANFPDYRGEEIITHHMGAMIPYFEGRVGYGWDQLRTRSTDEGYEQLLHSMKKRPLDYFKMFYADTALFGAAAATQCGLSFFGVDRVLFASDTPFEPAPGIYIRETIKVIEGLGLSAADKEHIYSGNARRLLMLN